MRAPSVGGERGVALIAVLWVTVCLVAVVLLFAESMRMEYRAGQNAVSALQSGQAVDGARRYLQLVLDTAEDGKGVVPDIAGYQAEAVPVGDALFWVIGRADQETTPTQVNTFGFVDEASKLNINTATVEMLERLPEMTADLAAAIVDWRDEDSEPEANGAESEIYSLKDPPYECKNAPFETVEELRLVHGFTRELLYGEDTNRNGVLDPNENDGDRSYPPDNGDGVLQPGLLEYLTVYSRTPNTRSDGSPRVNVADLQSRPALAQLLEETLEGGAGDIMGAIGAAPLRSVLEFYVRSRMSADQFKLIEDSITAHEGDTVDGLVNVNTAPSAVLACIPGIDEALASQIVSARRGKSADELSSIAWVAEVLGEAVAQAGPHLTGKTYRVSADIAALDRRGRGLRRAYVVFDTSGETAKVVYRSDWGALGWPLGDAADPERLATAASGRRIR